MSAEAEGSPSPNRAPGKRPAPTEDNALQPPATPQVMRHSSPDSAFSITDAGTPQDTPMASMDSLPIADAVPAPYAACAAQTNVPASTLPSNSREVPRIKRRKVLPSEKAQISADREAKKARREAEQRAKEAGKAQKAEEKVLEKRHKEEEKQQKQQEKDEAKRKKAEEREERQRQKEHEKQLKLEEQLKKERSQMRLSNFFALPKASPTDAHIIVNTIRAGTSPRNCSLTSKDAADHMSLSLEPADSVHKCHSNLAGSHTTPTRAKRYSGFLPFVAGGGVTVAAHNGYLPTNEERERINRDLDGYQQGLQLSASTIQHTFSQLRTKRGYELAQVQHVMRVLQHSPRSSIDCKSSTSSSLRDALGCVPLKYFFFGEDVRPPYLGTWTRPVSPRKARKLALAPMTQELSDVQYDVDSEAEWDDADEGEDVDIDGEDDDEEDDEEIEDFIDDDHAPQYLARRGLPVAEVETRSSGLQWENADGKLTSASWEHTDANFDDLAICFLMDPTPRTIDPFTTAYWDPEPKAVTPSVSSLMGPPRLPLSDRTNGQSNFQTVLVNGKVPKAVKAAPRLIPPECMADFKAAVNGSDMTKLALIEALKKQFPKLKKDEITETIKLIAHRVGSKREDKRWELIPDAI